MASTTTFALGFQIDSALQIRTATAPFEISQLRAVLDAEHYLKAGRPAGHVIWQGVYEHDPEDSSENLVAVLCWAGAAKRLKDRDTWIGWDAVTCANRLKLVVQLRRFVIPQKARRPNLAIQCLGLALNCKTLRSLKEAFKQVDDPRNPCNRRHPLSALLGMITYSLLCGAPDVKAMWAKCGPLNQHQRAAIGLTRRDPKSGLLKLPGYDALNDIINQVNPNSLAHAINQWLQSNSDLLPKTLAIDGKDLGGKGKLGAIVTLCHHHNGVPLAMRTYSGKKNDCELPVSQILLKQAAPLLANAVVTGDALDTQKKRH